MILQAFSNYLRTHNCFTGCSKFYKVIFSNNFNLSLLGKNSTSFALTSLYN